MPRFTDLQLVEPLRQALARQGYAEPTPIQAKAIPPLLAGRDLVGVAQTGTGKTAAYALPILQHIARTRSRRQRPVRALVLVPTRELARQIGKKFGGYAKFLDIYQAVIFGGVPAEPQVSLLERGADILVATPGRLLDLHRRGHVALDRVAHVVLDEADQMLDAGFIVDIRQLLQALPERHQAMLFSATLPPEVQRLASSFLRDPVKVEISSGGAAGGVRQQVMFVERLNKVRLLDHLLTTLSIERALVFTRTRRGADRLNTLLQRENHATAALHGDLSQAARNAAIDRLRTGEVRVLVATDVASRGLDIAAVDHVFNHELPYDPDAYVHRVGRTGRAGRAGLALTLCDETSGGLLRDIERRLGATLTPVFDQPWHSHDAVPLLEATGRSASGRGRRGRGKRRRR